VLSDGFSFLLKGGPVMWPLFLCAIVSVTIMIERYMALRGIRRSNRGLVREMRTALMEGRERQALTFLETRGGPVAHLLTLAVKNRHLSQMRLESLMEEVAIEETPTLARGLSILDTIITIAPLLGLLGTVTGMIRAFQVVAISSGMSAPAAITGGVAEALIATASGLAIAIVTLVGYNYLSDQVKAVVTEMEIGATKVVNTLTALTPDMEDPYATAKI